MCYECDSNPKNKRQISQAGLRLMSSCIIAQLKSDVFFRGLYPVSGFRAQKLRGYESSTVKTWILRLPSWRFIDSFHLHPAIHWLKTASREAKNRQNVGDSTSDPQMRCVLGHINLCLQMQQDQFFLLSLFQAKEFEPFQRSQKQILQGTLAQMSLFIRLLSKSNNRGCKTQPGNHSLVWLSFKLNHQVLNNWCL